MLLSYENPLNNLKQAFVSAKVLISYGNLLEFQHMTLPQFIVTESQSWGIVDNLYKLSQPASTNWAGERRLALPSSHGFFSSLGPLSLS